MVFKEADFVPGGDPLIHDTYTSVPLEEDDSMLQSYFDEVDGRKPEILMWEEYVVETPPIPVVGLPPAGQVQPAAKPKSVPKPSKSSAASPKRSRTSPRTS